MAVYSNSIDSGVPQLSRCRCAGLFIFFRMFYCADTSVVRIFPCDTDKGPMSLGLVSWAFDSLFMDRVAAFLSPPDHRPCTIPTSSVGCVAFPAPPWLMQPCGWGTPKLQQAALA